MDGTGRVVCLNCSPARASYSDQAVGMVERDQWIILGGGSFFLRQTAFPRTRRRDVYVV